MDALLPLDLATLIQTVGYLGIFLIVLRIPVSYWGWSCLAIRCSLPQACWHPKTISICGY